MIVTEDSFLLRAKTDLVRASKNLEVPGVSYMARQALDHVAFGDGYIVACTYQIRHRGNFRYMVYPILNSDHLAYGRELEIVVLYFPKLPLHPYLIGLEDVGFLNSWMVIGLS